MISRIRRPPLTGVQKQKYLQEMACPWCGGLDMTHQEDVTFTDGQVTQELRCSSCAASWRELYALQGIEDTAVAPFQIYRGGDVHE